MGRRGMFGSEAGLVRMGSRGPKTICTTSAASADSRTGVGSTLGAVNCQEAKYWRNWTFTLSGTFSGYSVQFLGTSDGVTWFVIDSPSMQGGEGVTANPLTSTVQSLNYDKPLFDVACVITGTAQTGTVSARVSATP